MNMTNYEKKMSLKYSIARIGSGYECSYDDLLSSHFDSYNTLYSRGKKRFGKKYIRLVCFVILVTLVAQTVTVK